MSGRSSEGSRRRCQVFLERCDRDTSSPSQIVRDLLQQEAILRVEILIGTQQSLVAEYGIWRNQNLLMIVNWDDGGAGGTFSANPVLTSSNGISNVYYTTPSTTGTIAVSATVGGLSTSATFTINVQ